MNSQRLRQWMVFACAAALVLGGIALAWRLYERRLQAARGQALSHLVAIADLKAWQIENWVAERTSDAVAIGSTRYIARPLRRFLAHPDDARERETVLRALAPFEDAYGYDELFLVDANGVVRLSTTAGGGPTRESIAAARLAMRTRTAQIDDTHGKGARDTLIAVAAPLLADVRADEPVPGAVILRVNPRRFLFPALQQWPVPSASGEAFLVERHDDSVFYLTPLKYSPESQPQPVRSIDAPGLLAAMAARGSRGALEGVDYRGVPVLGAAQKIQGTDWLVVSQMDAAEVYGPSRLEALLLASLVLMSLLGAGLFTAFWWRSQQVRVLASDVVARRKAESEHEKISRMYSALSALNELVARAQSSAELLQGACEIAVASGSFNLAVVRLVDAQTGLAHHAGRAGDMPYRYDRPLDVREGSRDGQSLSALAYRSARPAIGSGAEFAVQLSGGGEGDRLVRSAGAYPLFRRGAPVGILVLRSTAADAFDGESGRLLERMARDVSHGLDAIAADEELRRFRLALDNSADMIVLIDRETMRFVDVNNTVCRLLGYRREELIGERVADLLVTVSEEELARAYDELIADPSRTGALRGHYRCRDGTLLPFESTRHVLREGNRWLVAAVSRDMRERDAAAQALAASEQRIRESESRLRGIVQATLAPLLVVTREGEIVFANPAAAEVLGREHTQLAGLPLGLPLANGRPADVDILLPNGDTRAAEMQFAATDFDGREVLVVSLHDLSERRRYELHIEHLANHDALTGLPNRTLLRDRVQQAIVHARRLRSHVGLMFVDLDQFKLVNDSWGHLMGDALLLEVGKRLQKTIREGDTVARLGGDEFVVLLSDLTTPDDTAVVARKIAEALAEPLDLQGRAVSVTASIGISLYPGDGGDMETLLQCADAAMYRAKEAGRNTFQYYGAEMGAQARTRVETESGLRQAIERGELRLYYQPQVSFDTGEIRGFEALLRWQHPQRGLVSPASFIPIAEESGLILPIGQWALNAACRQAAAWAAGGLGRMKVAVNLSARQFWRGGVTELVRTALAESGLPASQLELEITESVVARDLQQVMLSLEQLRRLGVTVAIDDFGTGYSSLAYLRSLPIQKLKVDKSFIHGIPGDAEATALVGEIVRLAHVLALEVVAEGVETAEQAQFLRDAGCEAMQGFLVARPMPGDECAPLLRSKRRFTFSVLESDWSG